ncbi:hypothetical protein Tco_0364820 [Tanacetum coccineum]
MLDWSSEESSPPWHMVRVEALAGRRSPLLTRRLHLRGGSLSGVESCVGGCMGGRSITSGSGIAGESGWVYGGGEFGVLAGFLEDVVRAQGGGGSLEVVVGSGIGGFPVGVSG